MPSYYLRYFYAHDEVVARAADRAVAGRRGGGDRAASCCELYADPALDEKPELLAQRGGAFYSEAAVAAGAPRCSARRRPTSTQVVNVRNDGTLPFLPDDAVIEVPAPGRRPGVRRRCPSSRSTRCTPGWSPHVTAYEHLALEAALHGGRDRVFEALLAHPLVGQVDLADGLTDRLIAHNRDHLPWA